MQLSGLCLLTAHKLAILRFFRGGLGSAHVEPDWNPVRSIASLPVLLLVCPKLAITALVQSFTVIYEVSRGQDEHSTRAR